MDELWKTVKAVRVGPKGMKGVRCVSEEMMEGPSGAWEAMTRRGAGRLAIVAVEWWGDILCCCGYVDGYGVLRKIAYGCD